ncbi:hypothetical protein [Streptomyces chrestomyceticus]|uniref:Uncharacterized protein n=1 Tax=Streptomyces chrestomyceticus TaxID=68185 RepID=A0ABU7WNY6_9ACTN
MGRPPKLPEPDVLFAMLVRGDFQNQKEIAKHYKVDKAAVSRRLSKFSEPLIDFASLMPWDLTVEDRNQRPARALRLHLRSKLENETLSEAEERSHAAWISDLRARGHILMFNPAKTDEDLTSSEDRGWKYVDRDDSHEDFVAVLPEGHELPQETVDLYRMS